MGSTMLPQAESAPNAGDRVCYANNNPCVVFERMICERHQNPASHSRPLQLGETTMIQINRVRYIEATPEAVFAALADPNNLAGLIPRVHRVEIMNRQPNRARIVTQMSI